VLADGRKLTDVIISSIRAGAYQEQAALAAGISVATLHSWLASGRGGVSKDYVKFLEAVTRAKAEDEVRDLVLITKAASEDWKAAAWKRERMSPARYGPKIRVTLTAEFDSAVQRLTEELADSPDLLKRVLQVLAADEEGDDVEISDAG
jgi:hypothetical protein